MLVMLIDVKYRDKSLISNDFKSSALLFCKQSQLTAVKSFITIT